MECVEVIKDILKPNGLEIFSNIVMAFTGVVNLIIVIYFYLKDKSDAKSIRKNDYKLSWFNSMNFSKLGFEVQNNLENFNELIIKFSKDDVTEEELINGGKDIESSILTLKSKVLSLLKAIDDKKISEISELFRQMQDKIIKIQEEVIGKKAMNNLNLSEINRQIDSLKTEIIKSIFQAGYDFI